MIAGEATEFGQFFESTYGRILGAVLLLTRDPAAAEDAAQEAFARALSNWARVGAMAKPDGWVARTAMNVAIDAYRKDRSLVELDSRSAYTDPTLDELNTRLGLARLSPMQRKSAILHYLDGWSVREVSMMTRRSPETIKMHLRLARMRLRTLLSREPA